jgi:hypothetical protein
MTETYEELQERYDICTLYAREHAAPDKGWEYWMTRLMDATKDLRGEEIIRAACYDCFYKDGYPIYAVGDTELMTSVRKIVKEEGSDVPVIFEAMESIIRENPLRTESRLPKTEERHKP